MISYWSIWPRELNQNGCSFFRRNLQYRARLKGPLSVFSELLDFFRKLFCTEESPFNFLMFCDRMDVEKSQRVSPFSFFRHCETFIPKTFIVFKGSPSNFFWYFATEWMLKMWKGPPFRRASSVQLMPYCFGVLMPYFFGYCKNTWHFEVLLLFLRLVYGADVCRSRLVLPFIRFQNKKFRCNSDRNLRNFCNWVFSVKCMT